MPIFDSDWSLQFFEGIACPDDVQIPASDPDAWRLNPAHRWVYNKLLVAESQGFACAPFGIVPPDFPVFSKPMMNLHGMGADSAVLRSEADYDRLCRPGHFWMPYLIGDHVSTDVAVMDGRPLWWRHATGISAGKGMFDYWTLHREGFAGIEQHCGAWIEKHLAGYSGMINLETIGARIIEVHLRFADQWPDLYGGRPWVEALIRLYVEGRWEFEDPVTRDGYSVALFGPNGTWFRYPPRSVQQIVRAMPAVTSLQLTFHEDRAPEWHSNPPGGFRLAVINCWDLEAGLEARQLLAEAFDLPHGVNDLARTSGRQPVGRHLP
jgi:hypothetical protein